MSPAGGAATATTTAGRIGVASRRAWRSVPLWVRPRIQPPFYDVCSASADLSARIRRAATILDLQRGKRTSF